MKTLLKVNTDLILEYKSWEKANTANWNIASYLNQFHDLNAAIAFSKLYFPDFIEEQGCIILSFRYDHNTFHQWYKEFKGDIQSIEKHCNLYDLSDYFHINTSDYASDEELTSAIEQFAKILKVAWEANCRLLFPERTMIVESFKENDSIFLTLYSVLH